MTTNISSFGRPAKLRSAVVFLSGRNVAFSVGGVLAAAAFSVGASSSGTFGNTVNPHQITPGSASVQIAAREEDLSFSVTRALQEVRERTGVTWDQIASILGVSRRSVHAWMSGKSDVHQKHVSRVQELLHIVLSWSDEPAFKVRNRLLETFKVAGRTDNVDEGLPILMSENRPLKHPVTKKRSGSMRIRRG